MPLRTYHNTDSLIQIIATAITSQVYKEMSNTCTSLTPEKTVEM